MKITVDLSDNELAAVMRFAGEKKKGPAIRKFLVNELMLKRRLELLDLAMTGTSRIELPSWKTLRKRDAGNPWAR